MSTLRLVIELRPYKLSELSLELKLCNQSLKLILHVLHPQGISEMKTSAITVDKTVYCVTITVLQQLIAPQLCQESTASNENYAELQRYFASEI